MWNYFKCTIIVHLKSLITKKTTTFDVGNKGSNTGKRARRKNLRHPRKRFLVFNEDPPSWRQYKIIFNE
jgi:hypothetical protein